MKKRRHELFQTNDYEDIEEHLSKMAQKGWFLESIGTYFWTYRSGEPQNLNYQVTYFSEASDFNPYPTDNQEAYYGYCEAAGWTLVAEKGAIQVFRSASENATPIETDDNLRFRTIHKYMMKGTVVADGLLILILITMTLVMVYSFRSNPIVFFAESASLYISLYLIFAWIFLLYDVIGYVTWYYGNKKAIALGKKYKKKHYKGRRAITIATACIPVVIIVLALLTEIYWWRLLIGPTTMLISLGVKKVMKRVGASKEANMVITFMALFVSVFILFEASDSLEEYLNTHEGSYNGYDYEDESFQVLTMEDIQYNNSDSDEGKSSYTIEAEDSFAVSYIHMDETPQLDYEVANIKIGMLYDVFKNYFLDTHEAYGRGTFILVDEPAWEAEEVYQLKTETRLRDKYIICYENKILSIIPDFPLDMENIEIIRERLIDKAIER